MELHPRWHHARVLEGGVLDIAVSHMVLMSLCKLCVDLATMLAVKCVTFFQAPVALHAVICPIRRFLHHRED